MRCGSIVVPAPCCTGDEVDYPCCTYSQTAAYSFYIGKAIKEPCEPYQEIQVWGAPLGSIESDVIRTFNCLPTMEGNATSFDFADLPLDREAVVAMFVYGPITLNEDLGFDFEWLKGGARFYDYHFSIPAGTYAGVVGYSWVGHTAGEIDVDGDYAINLYLNGTLSDTFPFTVSNTGGAAAGKTNWAPIALVGVGLLALAYISSQKK